MYLAPRETYIKFYHKQNEKKKKFEEKLKFLLGFSLVLILVQKEVAQLSLQKYWKSVVEEGSMHSLMHFKPHVNTFFDWKRQRTKQPV